MTPPREPKLPYITLVPTPDVGERVVRLHVPQRQFSDATTIVAGMTMTAFLAALTPTDTTDSIELGYDDYTLTQPVLNDEGTDGTLSFYFAKPKASASLPDLTPFKEETKWLEYPWPAVLLTLYGLEGTVEYQEDGLIYFTTSSPYGGTKSTREVAEDRLALVPAQRISTEVIIRHYLSNVPFTDVPVETPITDTIQYSHRAMQRSIDCLHPLVRIPELLKIGRIIPDFGTPNASSVSLSEGQIYPETNQTTWQDHIYDAKYSEENGIYYLTTYEALAPALPKPILL